MKDILKASVGVVGLAMLVMAAVIAEPAVRPWLLALVGAVLVVITAYAGD